MAADSSKLATVLRAHGLRVTAQRQLVLDAVRDLGHATAEQVHESICGRVRGVNITTVYRTLDLLESLGLVAHTHLSHGAPVYHLAGDRGHVHLVCHRCGTVDEVNSEVFDELRRSLEKQRGFLLDVGHVALFGICAKCEKASH
ncbi:MAG TPA: Fur family transcriptional regulator [Stackebrandtia sp.]|jgi:Fur family ferric uptake transcriptional regulator|uniref:Fur family transcriptional regulator n=1 Tax=Stackebrandtia sp. TaxID=2023065 RepID=UPI002D59ADEB|nr:Fur family transcriptional regulator [Stackebrandtia sp.]HZE41943.1 Fur family transcriptional regulator [Stackebrandtia sp.]